MRSLVLALALTAPATAAPPEVQALTCPDDADNCELELTATLTSSRRDPLAKWDNLQFATVVDGKRKRVFASINIPHRKRLKLQVGTRYRIRLAAHKPFGAHDLWVIDATRR